MLEQTLSTKANWCVPAMGRHSLETTSRGGVLQSSLVTECEMQQHYLVFRGGMAHLRTEACNMPP